MDSSCEFEHLGEDEIQDARRNTEEDVCSETDSIESIPAVADVTSAAEANQNEELRRLMDMAQERVRTGSPSHSVVSTDSDFIHLPEEMMDMSSASSAGSRFNIIVNRDIHNAGLSDREDEEQLGMLDEVLPDADDRVESDIVVPQPAVVQEAVDELTLAVRPVRHYIHSPNRHLNTVLTAISLTALGFAIGIAIGHGIGSAREAHLQQEIQEGQKLRLRSVQDDLLMCLRKQEDIDQTINKLNEIENILVDAEHWRNEYEELLNLKLQNEEKWRLERGELKTSLAEVEKSHDQLLHTKSCAHDNEYLSRQESTLNSVHEKLEAGLSDKDLQIEKLQAHVLELKVSLLSADKMADAYKRSNDDKSLLILELKEKLLMLERELFDLNINSEEQVEKQNLPAETAVADIPVPSTEPQEAERGADEASAAATTESSPAAAAEADVEQAAASAMAAADDTVVDGEAPVAAESQELPSSDTVGIAACQQAVDNYRQEIGLLQQEIATLQHQLRTHQTDQSANSESVHESNNTNIPCIALNFCDHLKINISRDELLRAYEVTKGQYNSLQSFVLSEWWSFIGEHKQKETDENSSESDDAPQPAWKKYMSQTKSVVSDLLDTMNSSWQGVSDLSQKIGDTKIGKNTQKIQAKLSNVAGIVSRGVQVVKTRLSNVFDNNPVDSDSVPDDESQEPLPDRDVQEPLPDRLLKEPLPDRVDKEPLQEPVERVQLGSASKNKKFQRRLGKLRKDLHKLTRAKVDKMKRHAKKSMYERMDDFRDDFSHSLMNADLRLIRVWVDCQCSWWKREMIRESNEDYNLPMACADSLLPWQHPIGVKKGLRDIDADSYDGSWQFERAEMREFRRDEPDDWYWRRSHDYETKSNIKSAEIPFTHEEL